MPPGRRPRAPCTDAHPLASGRLDLYRVFDDAAITVYQSFWRGFVEPTLPLIVVPVVIGEWTLAFLILGRGRTARLGQLGGAMWNLFLAPFNPPGAGPWGIGCVALAAVHLWLATRTFDRTMWDIFFGRGSRAFAE